MSCFSETVVKKESLQSVQYKILLYSHNEKDAWITAIALGFIALFLTAASFVLFGMGTLSPTFLNGLGIFPYLGGALLSFVALGLIFGMLVFAAISSVRTCQKEKWQGNFQRMQS